MPGSPRSSRAGRAAFALGLGALLCLTLACAPDAETDLGAWPSLPVDAELPEAWQPLQARMAMLGDGFVVWESNRTGSWRLFWRRLDGSGLAQLSPDEPGRDHAAPHVSPDGLQLVYLSLPHPQTTFRPDPDAPIELRWRHLETGEERVLAERARPYLQNRAAVWIDSRRLIYIGGDGTTRELDVETGKEKLLAEGGDPRFGFLLNPQKTHATGGWPTFSPYHAVSGRVAPRRRMQGCQPYFSQDGRFGYWVAGSGGPIRSLDLRNGETRVVLDRRSEQMPEGRGYVYYPMISKGQRLLAYGSSQDQHGHFDADFEIFVVEIDPETLALRGTPVRYSFDPGQDRFPDVFLAGFELGRRRGEAPFRVQVEIPSALAPGGPEAFEWSFSDPANMGAEPGSHLYLRPGTYPIRAEREGQILRGEVRVAAAAPPELVSALVLPGGHELRLRFDEPIRANAPEVSFESGRTVDAVELDPEGRGLVVSLDEAFRGSDEVTVAGVSDRAQVPNEAPLQRARVAYGDWPLRGTGLQLLWRDATSPNRVRDAATGSERTFEMRRHGRARLTARGALFLSRGGASVEGLTPGFVEPFREADAFTVELTLTPERLVQGDTRIVDWADAKGRRNLSLVQRESRFSVRLRTTETGSKGGGRIALAPLSPHEPNHLLVTYRPGRLVAYRNGEKTFESDAVTGGLGDWRDDLPLRVGSALDGSKDWRGRLEGLALYSRFFPPEEAAAHANRFLEEVAARPEPERIGARGRVLARSATPSLEQIAPYREALAIHEVRLTQGRRKGETVRVAQWAILDGAPQPEAETQQGDLIRVELEPWPDNPQVHGLYTSDTLRPDPHVPLYLDVQP